MHALKLLRDCAVSGGLVATPSVLFWITLGLVLHSWPVMLAKTPVTGKNKIDSIVYMFTDVFMYCKYVFILYKVFVFVILFVKYLYFVFFGRYQYSY